MQAWQWVPELLRSRRPRSHRTRCSARLPAPSTGARCTVPADPYPSGMGHRSGSDPRLSGVECCCDGDPGVAGLGAVRGCQPRALGFAGWCKLIPVQLGWDIAWAVSPGYLGWECCDGDPGGTGLGAVTGCQPRAPGLAGWCELTPVYLASVNRVSRSLWHSLRTNGGTVPNAAVVPRLPLHGKCEMAHFWWQNAQLNAQQKCAAKCAKCAAKNPECDRSLFL